MKKWTYLVAALLTLGSTSVLTGCIDNDEPEGISVLRKAKAELITAKKAIVDAEAARLKSEAALNEAKAEVEKANAEIQKARAEQIKAETEAEKAKLEVEIKKLEAEAQEALNNALKAQYEAEAAYEKSRIEIAQAKAQMAQEMADALEYWYGRYDEAVVEYNKKYNAYIQAQRAYTAALVAAEKTAADAPEVTRDLEYAVVTAERDLAAAQDALENLNEALAEAKQMQPGDLQVKKAELEAEQQAAKEKKAELEVQKAEFRRENLAEFEKVEELRDAISAIESEEIEIPAFSYQFPEIGIPGYAGEREIVSEGYTFTVGAYRTLNEVIGEGVPNGTYYTNGDYELVESKLTREIENLQRLELDEDDQAWTTASINELEIEQGKLEIAYQKDEKWWKEAVAGYNGGEGADRKGAKLTEYTGIAELDAAITAYNTAAADLDAAKAAYKEEQAKFNEFLANSPGADFNAYDIYNAECQAAEDAYKAEMEQPQATYNAELKKLNEEYTSLRNEMTLAGRKYQIAQNLADQYPDDEDLQQAAEDAWDAYEPLIKEYDEFDYWNKFEKIQDVYNRAEAIAAANREVAYAEAQKKRQDTILAWGSSFDQEGFDAAYAAALAPLVAADKALNGAEEDGERVDGKIQETQALLQNVLIASSAFEANVLFNDWTYFSSWYNYNQTYNSIDDVDAETQQLPELDEFVRMTIANAKDLVIARSQALYGSMNYFNSDGMWNDEYASDKDYKIPAEHLLPRTQEDIKNMIQKIYPYEEHYQIADHYGEFGSYGRYLATGHQIAVAKAYLANGAELNNAILAINEQLKTMEELKTAQEEKIADAADAFVAQKETLIKAMQPLQDEFDAVGKELSQIADVLRAVNHALYDLGALEDLAGGNNYAPSQDAINAYIKALKSDVEAKEDDVFAKETALVQAQKTLADWNSKAINDAEVKKNAMEDAELEMNQAKEIMESHKADLDKVIAYLETVNE